MIKSQLNQDNKTVALIILEGAGLQEDYEGNALSLARMPYLKSLINRFPATSLTAAGKLLGYSEDVAPRCSLNHEIIGTGRPCSLNNFLINNLTTNKSFFRQKGFIDLIKETKEKMKIINIVTLCSTSEKHSSLNHLREILKYLKSLNLTQVYLHLILDGIDAPAQSGRKIIKELNDFLLENKIGEIKTVGGRFYAMDRSYFYDRTGKFFNAMTGVNCRTVKYLDGYLKESYEKQINDDEIMPVAIGQGIRGKENIFFVLNNRNDRFRQITEMIFKNNLGSLYTLMELDNDIIHSAICKKEKTKNTLAACLKEKKIIKYTISSPEKYAQVNYFFDGQLKTESNQACQFIVREEKEEVSILKRFLKEECPKFIVINISKIDNLKEGHSFKDIVDYLGRFDKVLKNLTELVLGKKGTVIITGDHGRIEECFNPEMPETLNNKNTNNQVPFVIINKNLDGKKINGFDLSLIHGLVGKSSKTLMDIAPTVLSLYGIEKPEEMNGNSLLD
jgi:2,3-bisphosphoglycerate-independent phosphoglycerate mutase